ncbi:MAG: hypothetical protein NVS3B26_14970 [Mycobacteriales bacterium]
MAHRRVAGDHPGDIRKKKKDESDAEGMNVAELKKGSRVTGGDRDKLAADLKKKYEAGQSIRLLAQASGRSYGFVHRILSESGATLRGRGGATRRKAPSSVPG